MFTPEDPDAYCWPNEAGQGVLSEISIHCDVQTRLRLRRTCRGFRFVIESLLNEHSFDDVLLGREFATVIIDDFRNAGKRALLGCIQRVLRQVVWPNNLELLKLTRYITVGEFGEIKNKKSEKSLKMDILAIRNKKRLPNELHNLYYRGSLIEIMPVICLILDNFNEFKGFIDTSHRPPDFMNTIISAMILWPAYEFISYIATRFSDALKEFLKIHDKEFIMRHLDGLFEIQLIFDQMYSEIA